MKQLSQPSDLNYKERKVCLAIGMFDGVHLGHQQVLRQAVRAASQNNSISVAITFIVDILDNQIFSLDKFNS